MCATFQFKRSNGDSSSFSQEKTFCQWDINTIVQCYARSLEGDLLFVKDLASVVVVSSLGNTHVSLRSG